MVGGSSRISARALRKKSPAHRSEERPRFAYFPFGGGTRACIGEEFAWNEGALVLATLGQRWRAKQLPGHDVRPEALFTVRPRGGLAMVIEAR